MRAHTHVHKWRLLYCAVRQHDDDFIDDNMMPNNAVTVVLYQQKVMMGDSRRRERCGRYTCVCVRVVRVVDGGMRWSRQCVFFFDSAGDE